MDAVIGWGVAFHGSRLVPARGGPAMDSDKPDNLDIKTQKNPY